MKTMNPKLMTAAALAAGALSAFAPSAFAAADWTCGLTSTTCSGTASPTIATAAFATTGSGATFAAATLGVYGTHLGVTASQESTTSPQHALDNSGAKEAVLLTFNQSVSLSELTLGWAAWDTDLTVLRYTGSAAPVLTNKTIGGLINDGWLSVGNYFDIVASPVQSNTGGDVNVTRLINAGTNAGASSWWLIAAYNSGYGGDNNGTPDLTTKSDYVKLLTVGGSTPTDRKVPEPAGLALVGLALIGMVGARKRVATKA